MSTAPDRFNTHLPGEPLALSEFPVHDVNAIMRLYDLYVSAVNGQHYNAVSYNSLSESFCRTMELLRDEAVDRNWCELYDEFLTTLPAAAQVRTPSRDTAWNGTLTYTVTFPVTVMARNEEAAADKLTDYYFSAFPDSDVHGTLPETDTVIPQDGIITELLARKITGEAQ